jgi:hypothetical protein
MGFKKGKRNHKHKGGVQKSHIKNKQHKKSSTAGDDDILVDDKGVVDAYAVAAELAMSLHEIPDYNECNLEEHNFAKFEATFMKTEPLLNAFLAHICFETSS